MSTLPTAPPTTTQALSTIPPVFTSAPQTTSIPISTQMISSPNAAATTPALTSLTCASASQIDNAICMNGTWVHYGDVLLPADMPVEIQTPTVIINGDLVTSNRSVLVLFTSEVPVLNVSGMITHNLYN